MREPTFGGVIFIGPNGQDSGLGPIFHVVRIIHAQPEFGAEQRLPAKQRVSTIRQQALKLTAPSSWNALCKRDSEQSFGSVEPISWVPPHLPNILDHVCVADAFVADVLKPAMIHSRIKLRSHLQEVAFATHLFSRMLLRICNFSLSVMPPKLGSLAYM